MARKRWRCRDLEACTRRRNANATAWNWHVAGPERAAGNGRDRGRDDSGSDSNGDSDDGFKFSVQHIHLKNLRTAVGELPKRSVDRLEHS